MAIIDDVRVRQTFDPTGENGGYNFEVIEEPNKIVSWWSGIEWSDWAKIDKWALDHVHRQETSENLVHIDIETRGVDLNPCAKVKIDCAHRQETNENLEDTCIMMSFGGSDGYHAIFNECTTRWDIKKLRHAMAYGMGKEIFRSQT